MPRRKGKINQATHDISQVTQNEGKLQMPEPLLVCPKSEFLDLIRLVGAKGTKSSDGELFTYKQLCHYLKEYIKLKSLYDPLDPRVVYCGHDPLGQIFNVTKFTINEVLSLLSRNTTPGKRKTSHSIASQISNREHHYAALQETRYSSAESMPTNSTAIFITRNSEPVITSTVITPENKKENRDSGVSDEEDTVRGPIKIQAAQREHIKIALPFSTDEHLPKKGATATVTASTSAAATKEDREKQEKVKEDIKKGGKRKGQRKSETYNSSCSTDSKTSGDSKPQRRRQPSFSILYSDGDVGAGSYPWCFRVEVQESDESEVLSIQSKETVAVQDSSDDLWFLDSEGDISVQMDDDGFSIELQSVRSDPPFAEEYEVDSEFSSASYGMENDSDSSEEELLLVCSESDVEFWADSESSDAESEDSSDDEFSEGDKWHCEECDTFNSPIHSQCDRCWCTRPGWLPEQKSDGTAARRRHFTRSLSAPSEMYHSSSSCSEEAAGRDKMEPKLLSASSFSHDQSSREKSPKVNHKIRKHSKSCSYTLTEKETEVDIQPSTSQTNNKLPALPKASMNETPPLLSRTSTNENIPSLSRTSSNENPPSLSRTSTNETLPLLSRASTSENLPSLSRTSSNENLLSLSRTSTNDTMILSDWDSDLIKERDSATKTNDPVPTESSITTQSTFGFNVSDEAVTGIMPITSSQNSLASSYSFDITQSLCSQESEILSSSGRSSFTLSHNDSGIGLTQPLSASSIENVSSSQDQGQVSNSSQSRKRTYASLQQASSSSQEDKYMSKEKIKPKKCKSEFGVRSTKNNATDDQFLLKRCKSESFSSQGSTVKKGPDYSDKCMICLSRPKDASIIHGKSGHQVCCYSCAKRLCKRGKRCPVCRKPIERVIKNFLL